MPSYDSYLTREEDGTSHYLLEDGSGSLILETAQLTDTPADENAARNAAGHIMRQRLQQQHDRLLLDDEDTLLLILTTL